MERYRGKISGPLLDRIDLHVEVNRPARAILNGWGQKPEDSATVRERVVATRTRQMERSGVPNAQLNNAQVRHVCHLPLALESFLETVAEKMSLSPRACQRILKVSLTLAELDESKEIGEEHLTEAITYRGIDGKNTRFSNSWLILTIHPIFNPESTPAPPPL